jgi:hypothetical protein
MEHNLAGAADSHAADAERKLWLDYLKAINDRRLQSSQRSGLTSYVLLAVLGGLLYQFVPKLPKFLAAADYISAGIITTALEANAAIYLFIAYCLLIYYCAGGTEHRIMPEQQRRTATITQWTTLFFGLSFSVFQLYIGNQAKFSQPICQSLRDCPRPMVGGQSPV